MKARTRCSWVPEGKPDYADYHDTEWGEPVHDDRTLLRCLILEAQQASFQRNGICSSSSDVEGCPAELIKEF